MEQIAVETRWVTGVPVDRGGSGDPSPVTARGVHQGMRAAAERVWGAPTLAGRTVAIQGLGHVGAHLASLLRADGARVFGCDIDAEAMARARAEHGVEPVACDELLDLPCDVFAPCALGATINERTIPRLKARVIAGAANNQLADERRDGEELHRRGILYAPDFLINAGGLVNVYNEYIGYDRERALRMADRIFDSTRRVFEIAERDGIAPWLAGERLAEERLAAVERLGPRNWERLARERVPVFG
jgi:leucine dehydrogenase